jgi:hypothetical protein
MADRAHGLGLRWSGCRVGLAPHWESGALAQRTPISLSPSLSL